MAFHSRMEDNGANDIISLKSVSGTELLKIKIKPLDSHIYHLQVNKQIPVIELKEQVSMITGVKQQHQRILYAGRVLRDEHPGPLILQCPRWSHTSPGSPKLTRSARSCPDGSEGHSNLDIVNQIISFVIANFAMSPTEDPQVTLG